MGFFLLVPLIVLGTVIFAAVAALRLVVGGVRRRPGRSGRAGGPLWLLPVLLLIALVMAFEGVQMLSPLMIPLLLIGLGVLLLRAAPRAPGPATVARARGPWSGASAPLQGLQAASGAWSDQPLTAPTLDARIRRLPPPAREEAMHLAAEARRAVSALDEQTPAEQAYTIRATLEDYLPESVNAFLDIPEARRQAPLPNGQTPVQVLRGQLRLMREGFERAVEGQGAASAERLLAHKRFLEDRFGKGDDFKL